MGLDAHIFCNCLKNKTSTEPPVSREMIYIDPDGILDIHFPENMPEEEQDRLWHTLYDWSKNCCPHSRLHFCEEHVGNWAAVRHIQQIVQENPEEYPVLSTIFPSGNGGSVNTEKAILALRELEAFCLQLTQKTGIFLTDINTGNDLYSYISCYDGVIARGGGKDGVQIGFDADGLFVRHRETGVESFRSKHFKQQALPDEEWNDPSGKTYMIHPSTLIDVNRGQSFRIDFCIGQDRNIIELEVITHPLCEQDFYAIQPLKRLFQAAKDTGNEIYWC